MVIAEKEVNGTGSILPLRLEAASVVKRGKKIVGPITTEIGRTGCTIVMGPNGAGKSTLLRLMHGLEQPRQGTVTWRVPDREARHKQSFVFQAPVVMRRTVLENIAYPKIICGASRKEAKEIATHWCEKVGLSQACDREAHVLSGGEKQKLAIARALIVKPDVLFLDEPTTNLDGRATREIETILLHALEQGTRLIMATHDMGQAKRLGQDVMFLYRGALHETGTTDRFFENPTTREARAFLDGDIVE
ncbi:MAG: ATP-binding cassette domain-containing protein [Stappiaceae bacterium]